MNKNTKLLLGAGIVGVGAYLLFKSKKATTPALTASAPANLVGFDTGKFYDVKGGHAGVQGEGVFASAAEKKASMVGEVGPVTKSFANQPFNFGGSQVVGERKVGFADAMGDRQVAADGGEFEEKRRTNRREPNNRLRIMPIRRTLPVEPVEPVTPRRTLLPVNNFASLQGASGMINTFDVKSGIEPFVNR